jgi:hypothetical protein
MALTMHGAVCSCEHKYRHVFLNALVRRIADRCGALGCPG